MGKERERKDRGRTRGMGGEKEAKGRLAVGRILLQGLRGIDAPVRKGRSIRV